MIESHSHQEQLIAQSEHVQTPFVINLSNNQGSLRCTTLLRLLPHKRIACFAEWENRPVFAKLFFDSKRQAIHFQREVDGANALARAHILTPELLFSGQSDCATIHIVIYEKIPNAINFLDVFSENPTTLVNDLLDTIAAHHLAGIFQHDLHLNNFLIVNKLIYTIDCADVHKQSGSPNKSLTFSTSINNLGLLYAQLTPAQHEWISTSFAIYTKRRNWKLNNELWHKLHKAIKRAGKQRQQHYLKKIYRNCTEFITEHSLNHYLICRRDHYTPQLSALLNKPDECFTKGTILKAGRSSTIALITLDNQQCVVKRYNIKNYRHAISRCWRPSRAWHSWRNAHHLQLIGINTPKPIALLEHRFGPLRKTAYFIMEYTPGTTLAEFVDPNHQEKLTTIMPALKNLFSTLKQARISHGDMKATNFIVANNTLTLLDLDATKQHQFNWRYSIANARDKQRFLKNWQGHNEIIEEIVK